MNSEYPYPKMNAQNRGLSCFDLRILITLLVSTNSSSNTITEYPSTKTFTECPRRKTHTQNQRLPTKAEYHHPTKNAENSNTNVDYPCLKTKLEHKINSEE
jgi:hypothetical protein